MEKSRVEAFSDGVLAIAITILVLELKVPAGADGHLGRELLHEWPSYVGYAVSFTLIGIIWVNHHALFKDLATVDRPMLFFNLLLLFFVVLIPFPTELVATYVDSPADGDIAVALYSAVMLGMAMSFLLCFLWSHNRGLFRLPLSQAGFRSSLLRILVGVVIYSFAIGLAFVDARLTLAFHGVVAVFYLIDQSTAHEEATRLTRANEATREEGTS